MNAKPKPDHPRKPRREVGRVIRRLLSAVDLAIEATDEAKQARDELVRLSQGNTQEVCK